MHPLNEPQIDAILADYLLERENDAGLVPSVQSKQWLGDCTSSLADCPLTITTATNIPGMRLQLLQLPIALQ